MHGIIVSLKTLLKLGLNWEIQSLTKVFFKLDQSTADSKVFFGILGSICNSLEIVCLLKKDSTDSNGLVVVAC